MTGSKNGTRRAFFLQGGAVLGAGVATTAGASALAPGEDVAPGGELKQLRQHAEQEAIRRLQLEFAVLLESQSYEAAAELFDEQARLHLSGLSASGKPAIRQLFVNQYRGQKAGVIHSAYRHDPLQQSDAVSLSEDRLRATATFPVEVQLCTPLPEDCTAAQMARLQGQVAERRWETGRFEAQYVKTHDRWRISALSYIAP